MSLLMTGVTGILGSEIALALAKTEDVFFLVREKSLTKIPKGINMSNLVFGDVTLPMCWMAIGDDV